MQPEKHKSTFLSFNYPELKDLGKHFLTISSATAVLVVTFFDRITHQGPGDPAAQAVTLRVAILALLVSIVCAGTGLFTNYIAGAGASGAIIWGIGRNYRAVTIVTYVLYMFAGLGMATAYVVLAMTVMIS